LAAAVIREALDLADDEALAAGEFDDTDALT
jgi:hypothetical protein